MYVCMYIYIYIYGFVYAYLVFRHIHTRACFSCCPLSTSACICMHMCITVHVALRLFAYVHDCFRAWNTRVRQHGSHESCFRCKTVVLFHEIHVSRHQCHVCMVAYIYIYIYICMYVCMYVCVYVCMYVYICMYVCILHTCNVCMTCFIYVIRV